MTEFNFMRAADLHLAYQHGEATANGDTTSEPEFREKFVGDEEAQAEYVRGFAAQTVLKLEADIDCGDPPEYAVSFVGSMPMVRSD